MEGNEYMYVYNLKQALWLIQSGIIPVDMGKGNKDIFVKFKRGSEKLEELMQEWIERGKRF